jgi:predicted metal-binding membrane protein
LTVDRDTPSDSQTPPVLTRDKLGILVASLLVAVAAVSWAATYYLMPIMMMGDPSMSGMMGVAGIVSSSPSPAPVGLFVLVWVVGMSAMMFPAMIPVMVFYNKVATKVEPDLAVAKFVGTPLFLLGYLATYAGLGLLAYLAVSIALDAAPLLPTSALLATAVPAMLLVLAGVYQFTPLKSRCLTHCVSPVSFFAIHSRRGLLGSLKMGFSHGRYCVGCCWAYMLVMLAVAAMSLPFMAILAGVIAVEKVIVRGASWFTSLIGAGFVLLGVGVFFFPSIMLAL